MTVHKLKIKDIKLLLLLSGFKKAEIRFNDRNYKTGDILNFKTFYFRITHIEDFGLKKDYLCLSVLQVNKPWPIDIKEFTKIMEK